MARANAQYLRHAYKKFPAGSAWRSAWYTGHISRLSRRLYIAGDDLTGKSPRMHFLIFHPPARFLSPTLKRTISRKGRFVTRRSKQKIELLPQNDEGCRDLPSVDPQPKPHAAVDPLPLQEFLLSDACRPPSVKTNTHSIDSLLVKQTS